MSHFKKTITIHINTLCDNVLDVSGSLFNVFIKQGVKVLCSLLYSLDLNFKSRCHINVSSTFNPYV